MSNNPALILQMQRMGDIILSFPLFLWAARTTPDRPIWVVAEPHFYEELLHVSPKVTYLPWTAIRELSAREYSIIVNLSHRPEAADLTGKLSASMKFGPVKDPQGLHISGRWQLYRAALTGNNRHNRFHWAELNALDCVDNGCFSATHFDTPRILPSTNQAVGLFLGASQVEKRPDPPFWAALAKELERRGMTVVLMGGPAEVPLGEEVRRLHGGRLLDTCGSLSLREFMAVGQTLSLMVTPDTGPMHLAAWSGLQTLNLSMGPVNPWETGPFQPGHHVLRASMSCLDCWHCSTRPRWPIWPGVWPARPAPGVSLRRRACVCTAPGAPRRAFSIWSRWDARPRAPRTVLASGGAVCSGTFSGSGTKPGPAAPGRIWPGSTRVWQRPSTGRWWSWQRGCANAWCPAPRRAKNSGRVLRPCSAPWRATSTCPLKTRISRGRPLPRAWA
ncbi:MAG: putative glycosyl transferase family [Desulfovibrionaceae bacterium]|nr:MAG: putative glycosyl transferase family [Desulfovibrionaceae bacterium]